MADVSASLLDYVLSLLEGGDAAEGFAANPEGALEAAGLAGVCGADLDAILPTVLDYAPVSLKAAGMAGAGSAGAAGAGSAGAAGGVWAAPIAVAPHGDHAAAVQTLQNIVQNYSYTSTSNDVNTTMLDQSQNLALFAGDDIDDLEIDFENNSVVTSGDGNVVGDDNTVGNTVISDSGNTETEIEIEDSFNTDNSVNTEDSFNTDIENEDSFNTDNSINTEDSFNDESDNSVTDDNSDNSINTDVEIEDSFQANTETDVEIEDSFQANTEIEDSFQANTEVEVEIDDIDVDL